MSVGAQGTADHDGTLTLGGTWTVEAELADVAPGKFFTLVCTAQTTGRRLASRPRSVWRAPAL